MAKIANPQGKGNHLLNNHWYPVITLQEKSEKRIINDFLLSSLVLSAAFSFKPVLEVDYYLIPKLLQDVSFSGGQMGLRQSV